MKKDKKHIVKLTISNFYLFDDDVLIEHTSIEDLKYLLKEISDYRDLDRLCGRSILMKKVLNEFLLDNETIDKFNTIIENADVWYKVSNMHTIFDMINFYETYWLDDEEWLLKHNYEIDQELLELNESNKCIYSLDLNENQRLELIEVLKNNEIALNKLNQIIDNHLEDNYDFESLMQHLKKKEKKNLMNI